MSKDFRGAVCLFVCVCVFVRLRIFQLRIKLAASHFVWRFIGVQGRKCTIFVNFAPPEAQNRTNQQARGPRPPHVKITVEMRRPKRHARDAPFVKSCGVWTYDRHVWIYVTVLPATHTFIHEWDELSCLYSQPHSITALWPVLISRPTEGWRLSIPRWLVENQGVMLARRRSPIPVPTDR